MNGIASSRVPLVAPMVKVWIGYWLALGFFLVAVVEVLLDPTAADIMARFFDSAIGEVILFSVLSYLTRRVQVELNARDAAIHMAP